MKILFESEKACLNVKCSANNGNVPVGEYIEFWYTIQRHVEVLKPAFLLIDAELLEFRSISAINSIFNRISECLSPQNITIIESKNAVGINTLKALLEQCPFKGHILLNHR